MTTKQIELTEIELRKARSYEGANAGRWVAKVQYSTPSSETSILLTPLASEELLAFLGPLLVKHATAAAQAVAFDMQASIDATTVPALSPPSAPASVEVGVEG